MDCTVVAAGDAGLSNCSESVAVLQLLGLFFLSVFVGVVGALGKNINHPAVLIVDARGPEEASFVTSEALSHLWVFSGQVRGCVVATRRGCGC
jgi:hypothetical protein